MEEVLASKTHLEETLTVCMTVETIRISGAFPNCFYQHEYLNEYYNLQFAGTKCKTELDFLELKN